MTQEIFDYEQIDPGHYDRVFERGTGIQSLWHHIKFRRLRKELGDYDCHLDVGCGPGTFVGTLNKNRVSIGVDIAAGQIKFAQKKHQTGKHSFQVVQPGELPFEDSYFDVITVNDLIEHLYEHEIEPLLAEVGRVIRRR